jgi:non-homologous end joining protein Ku
VVIRDALKRKDRVALARVVLSNREHIIALKPLGGRCTFEQVNQKSDRRLMIAIASSVQA